MPLHQDYRCLLRPPRCSLTRHSPTWIPASSEMRMIRHQRRPLNHGPEKVGNQGTLAPGELAFAALQPPEDGKGTQGRGRCEVDESHSCATPPSRR